jgi:hypothetical protein
MSLSSLKFLRYSALLAQSSSAVAVASVVAVLLASSSSLEQEELTRVGLWWVEESKNRIIRIIPEIKRIRKKQWQWVSGDE